MRLKLKSRLFLWKWTKRWEKKSYYKKMQHWLTWHIPFTKDDKVFEESEDYNEYCPNCGSIDFKNNGEGFFRCRDCKERFIILISTDKKWL